MRKMTDKLLIGLLLCIGVFKGVIAQNDRDKVIHEVIMPYLFIVDNYENIKKEILQLEERYGYEPELKYMLLEKSYEAKDYSFFKKELSYLVEHYGVSMDYFNGREKYFKAITTGELASWFKEMYLKKHFIWMEKNFLKQRDVRRLNTLNDKQLEIVTSFERIRDKLELNKEQEEKLGVLYNEAAFEHFSEFFEITQKWKMLPTPKNFALIQHNGLDFLSFRNISSEENFERFWILFYPYYKKAYLKNDATYNIFKYVDYFSYKYSGKQKFGLLSSDDIDKPWDYFIEIRTELKNVPIEDLEFCKKSREEFKWTKLF